jgi:hypothetical protein
VIKKIFLFIFIGIGLLSFLFKLGALNFLLPVHKETAIDNLKTLAGKSLVLMETPLMLKKGLNRNKGLDIEPPQKAIDEHEKIMQQLEEEKLKAEIADLKSKNNIFDKGTILSIFGICCTLYLGRKKKT